VNSHRFILLCLAGWISIQLSAVVLFAQTPKFPLKTGYLHVPENVEIVSNEIDLIIHLHGASAVVEKNIVGSRPNVAWVNLTLPGLSSVYRNHFQDAEVFPSTLNEVRQKLRAILNNQKLQIRHLTLMSFSAGFGGVRELLKQPAAVAKIDAIVMADSLYAGFVGELSDRKLNEAHLKPFLSFAKLAAKGSKQMLLSYTQLFTPNYASTKETGTYLIHKLGGTRNEERKSRSKVLVELSRFKLGKFNAYEFEGATGEDHMNHLRFIHLFLDEIQTRSP
jgi:hypothetical protein